MRRSLGTQRVLKTIQLPGKQFRKARKLNGLRIGYKTNNINNDILCNELIITVDTVVVVAECLHDSEVVAY